MEIELAKHIDLIDDDRIKAYIAKKREAREFDDLTKSEPQTNEI